MSGRRDGCHWQAARMRECRPPVLPGSLPSKVKRAVRAGVRRPAPARRKACSLPFPLQIRLLLPSPVCRHQKPVGNGVTRGIEETPAAMDVAPALEGHALRVGADEEIGLECLVGDLGEVLGSRNMRLTGMAELEFRAFFLAIGTSVRDGRGRRLVDQPAARKRSSEKGALIGCGSPLAMVWAKTCPEPASP
jgi:hypothetical protein